MLLEKAPNFRRIVVRGVINEQDDALDRVPSRVRDEIAEVLAKLDVSSSRKGVPDNALMRPEEGNKTVYSLGVSKRSDIPRFSSGDPARFDFWKEFSPLLVLKSDEDLFLKRAGAMRL